MEIDMTAPVTTRVNPGEGPNCENNFTMSFYVPAAHQDNPLTPTKPNMHIEEVPAAHQDNPPRPTNPDVYIEERPELHVFSRWFQGFASDKTWCQPARKASTSRLRYH
ncbi:putative heme-binding protein 2-like isoform X1 [Penaeus vannamei]|uniref:Putative heme-binding protein 2-like isoform X1 n=1 Tax=Penaeus vannamei TaxID=6689 RepID=A0A3R7M2M7_PENVA|nr:heme-binding protein 2-like [Penaeus vannamei]ROT70102.1 putative heme-binding protein 2-like isoform X1 [Penaeus vannamei]